MGLLKSAIGFFTGNPMMMAEGMAEGKTKGNNGGKGGGMDLIQSISQGNGASEAPTDTNASVSTMATPAKESVSLDPSERGVLKGLQASDAGKVKYAEVMNQLATSMNDNINDRVSFDPNAGFDLTRYGSLPAYKAGGIANGGKPAIIVDAKSGRPVGTMNEEGAEEIIPAENRGSFTMPHGELNAKIKNVLHKANNGESIRNSYGSKKTVVPAYAGDGGYSIVDENPSLRGVVTGLPTDNMTTADPELLNLKPKEQKPFDVVTDTGVGVSDNSNNNVVNNKVTTQTNKTTTDGSSTVPSTNSQFDLNKVIDDLSPILRIVGGLADARRQNLGMGAKKGMITNLLDWRDEQRKAKTGAEDLKTYEAKRAIDAKYRKGRSGRYGDELTDEELTKEAYDNYQQDTSAGAEVPDFATYAKDYIGFRREGTVPKYATKVTGFEKGWFGRNKLDKPIIEKTRTGSVNVTKNTDQITDPKRDEAKSYYTALRNEGKSIEEAQQLTNKRYPGVK